MLAARSQIVIQSISSFEVFTDEENEVIINFHEGRLIRGTDEYLNARKFAKIREKKRFGS